MTTREVPRKQLNVHDLYRAVGWTPHQGQQKIINSTARHRVVSAGRRFGKSALGGHELLPYVYIAHSLQHELRERQDPMRFWLCGPGYSDSEKEFRALYNALSALQVPFDKPGTYNNPINGDMHISLWRGMFQVDAKSAIHPETLVGEGLCGVIMCEAAKLRERVWTRFIRPTLADKQGWSIHSSTPEGKNWFYHRWKAGQDPQQPEWASWRMPSWMNNYVYRTITQGDHVRELQRTLRGHTTQPAETLAEQLGLKVDQEIVNLIVDLTEPSFNQEIAADFTEFVGLVFQDFDEEVHVFDLSYQPGWDTVAAVDYGFTNPNVWLLLQIGPFNEINVLDEFYQSELTPHEFADEVHRRGLAPSGIRTFFPDPASPGDTRVLEDKLKLRHSEPTGGELKHRIDMIRAALKLRPAHLADDHPEKMPQLRIDRRCVNTIHEMSEYRYPEKRDESSTVGQELPMKKDDHTPEALGRFFRGYFETVATRGHGRVRKARVRA